MTWQASSKTVKIHPSGNQAACHTQRECDCIYLCTLNKWLMDIVHENVMLSEPTTPIPPPFEDSYKVDYNDGMSGFCSDPKSTAKPCAGQDKVNFHFDHCSTGQPALWHNAGRDYLKHVLPPFSPTPNPYPIREKE